MVHVDAEQGSEKRIRLAIDLADRFDATLIGIAGWSLLPVRLSGGGAAMAERGDPERDEMRAILDGMGRAFCSAARQTSKVEWRGMLDYSTDLVPRETRAADLIIIGRKKAPRDLFFSLDPGATIIQAGRPVLVVPDAIEQVRARRVVVAWKDTREARRAVRDALPLLHKAEEVIIVAIGEDETQARSEKQLEDVADYLVRHGVIVGAKIFLPTNGPLAAEMIRFVQDQNSDLLVAGGYGHSRAGELMFGGMTRGLLMASPVCCLFSH
jgi:nucleotide-binding universal stress UspA family protein